MFGHNDGQPQQPINNDTDETSSAPVLPSETPVANPVSSAQAWAHPGTPLGDSSAPAAGTDNVTHPSDNNVSAPTGHDDLLELKQKALGQLTPIVGHLEQSPEEKFRTLMMMIQATDDQSMLQEAYDTAQNITDEKTKAQALLDVVNEINYFTQHKN